LVTVKVGFDEAAVLSKLECWSTPVALSKLPRLDLFVAGAVAVTPDRWCCGKGHDYNDIECAILLGLGHPPVPVFTTVHELQVVSNVPVARHHLPVSVIVAADRFLRVLPPPPSPVGIDWGELPAEVLAAMPVLRELQELCDG
jgi:5-formyltetrahydrofolate cyclo-ligase